MILAVHCKSFVHAIVKATKEEELVNLDEERSREDLTQGFSATCNPGPLCEPRPSNPYMSEQPSSPTRAPCYDVAGTQSPYNAVNSKDTNSRDKRSREALQGSGKETEC